MYTITDNVPRFIPNSPATVKTANVWRVNGTVMGIEIHEQTAISAADKAMTTMSAVLIFLLDFFVLDAIFSLIKKTS
jgi:hypothetical protein